MESLSEKAFSSFDKIAEFASTDNLKLAVANLREIVSAVASGLRRAGLDMNEENLKLARERSVSIPSDNIIEERVDAFIAALGADPNFQNHSFICVDDFHKCKSYRSYNIAWCVLALAICLAERVVPLAGGGKK